MAHYNIFVELNFQLNHNDLYMLQGYMSVS